MKSELLAKGRAALAAALMGLPPLPANGGLGTQVDPNKLLEILNRPKVRARSRTERRKHARAALRATEKRRRTARNHQRMLARERS